ncbi:pentatricopeptide repeat-containing protein At5g48910-like, partial [Carica papaya]|uniref:pentatricopeptide repeat-containing protein At5g48910-like n=1 Tax=Carica papaya TaxID=3649 RepID=UPI000B8CE91F
MYAKCGCINLALDVFENMNDKEVFSWNTVMGGLDMHARADDAIKLFFKIQRERVLRPNRIILVCVLNACDHVGWVDKGLKIFNSMQKIYGVEPKMKHYGCVVDLLGRIRLLEEAEELIASMPMKPNAAVWGALLGACRIHKNVELGERIEKILLEMDPLNLGRGIRTTPRTGIIHEFKMGDGSHPQVKKIHMMLVKIIEKLQIEGYSPNTSQVLFDVSEEEKETALKYHSEKLTIAFGLLNTKPGTPIRIIKNLK